MVYEPLYHALQIIIVTVHVCSKLKQAKNRLFLQIKSKNSRYIVGAFNKTIIYENGYKMNLSMVMNMDGYELDMR